MSTNKKLVVSILKGYLTEKQLEITKTYNQINFQHFKKFYKKFNSKKNSNNSKSFTHGMEFYRLKNHLNQ